MNVLVIPSWYPSGRNPLAGTFIREQVRALADVNLGIRPIVSTWGFDDGLLPIRSPKIAIQALLWRFRQPSECLREIGGIWEAFTPLLSFSSRLLGQKRTLDRLVRVNLNNFRQASERFGPIGLVHAHVGFPAAYIAKKVAEQHGVPYVVTEHMGPFPFVSMQDANGCPIAELMEGLDAAAVRIAVSSALADRMESFGLIRPVVIPNLVDERFFYPVGAQGGRFSFLTVCSITKAKGVDTLIRAIALWAPARDEVEFRIVGEGPQMDEFRRLAEELGVADLIVWLGQVSRDDIPMVFRACNAFVLPSEFETFGVVYAEAIACGKPVIATRCGGPESIVNDANGVLVEVGDAYGLAEAMRNLSQRSVCFDATSIRSDFMARFSREAVARQLVNLYNSLPMNPRLALMKSQFEENFRNKEN